MKYAITLLTSQHDRKSFRCNNKQFETYLQKQASQDSKKNASTCYVMTEPSSVPIIGYYTLSTGSIKLNDFPEKTVKYLRRYQSMPAILLGRLAIDERYTGKGLGKVLLVDALKRSYQAHTVAAATAIYVEAIDETAIAFYKHCGFEQLKERPQQLFMLMQDIEALMG